MYLIYRNVFCQAIFRCRRSEEWLVCIRVLIAIVTLCHSKLGDTCKVSFSLNEWRAAYTAICRGLVSSPVLVVFSIEAKCVLKSCSEHIK